MNRLEGTITNIKVSNQLSLVEIDLGGTNLTAIVIDTPESAPYLQKDNRVNAIFKETEVIIGKGKEHHLSLRNRLVGTIDSIDSGELLSRVEITTPYGKVVSVITTNAIKELHLEKGSEVTTMIKTNEIMLST